MVQEQSEPRKEYWLSEAILVAFFTAMAYLVAFFYELGYTKFFGIPIHFIEISIVKIIISFCLVSFFALFVVLGGSSFLWMYVPKKYNKISAVGLPAVLFFTLVLIANIDIWPTIIYLIFGFIIGYSRTASLQPKNRSKQLIYRILDKHVGENFASLVRKGLIWLPLLFVLSFSVGKANAAWKKTFLVSENFPNTVVLRKYGDILVCAPFDSESREIKGHFIIRRMTEISELRFTVQSVGPLKKAGKIVHSYIWKDVGWYILHPSITLLGFIMIFTIHYVRLSKKDLKLTIQEKIKQSFEASWLWFLLTAFFLIHLHQKIQQGSEKATTTVIQKVPKDIIP